MRFIIFCFLLFAFYFSNAQQFGGEPSSVKWKQVNTDTVRIIFPQGMDSMAKRIATITLKEQQQYNNTIGKKLHKIDILLHNQTTFSNAFVALGPWRSEFFLTPPQNAFELSAMSWNDLLSIHEYRHAEQYSNFNVGLSHTMHVLFGQNGQALANSAAIPNWFFEGDAVYNETLLSEQGRGRLPLFLNAYKCFYLQSRNYSYMKLRNGSYKNYIPDHYPLGYMLVAYGREKYGDNFWKDVTQYAAAYKSLFYPMQHAIKNYAHISFNEFISDAFKFYQQQWNNKSLPDLQFIDSLQKNDVINNKYPYTTNDGSIIYLHKTYRAIPQFEIRNKNGAVKKIAVQDIAEDDYFSYNNGKIIYASYKPDSRWGNKEYSEIRLLDVNTNQEQKISFKSRYFSPDISHDGKTTAAVEQLIDNSSKLVLIDSNKNIVEKVDAENGHIFSYPKFSGDDKSIYVCDRNAAGEMRILKMNIDDKSSTEIIPYANRIIGFPVVQNDTLFYSCSANGNDEVWAYINSQNKNYRVATASTGLYQSTMYQNKMLVSAFTADGYRLALIQPGWQPVNNSDTLKSLYASKPFHQQSNGLVTNITVRNFSLDKYKKTTQLFNFHSLSPYFNDPDYSLILYGQNVLNTFQSQLYYTYNTDENFNRVGYTGIYGGWYLQPFVDVNQTWHRTAKLNANTSLHWNETKFAGGVQLPLNFTEGRFYRNLNLQSSYNVTSVQWQGQAKEFFHNSNFNYIQSRITYNQFIQQAVQNIYPRFGQTVYTQFRAGSTAHQLLLNGYFYFPGIIQTHSLVINLAYQLRDTSNKYYFDNNFPFSRGYDALNYPRMFKAGFNYNFHLLYPDWGFGNLVYFLRVRGNVYYDFTQVTSLRTGSHYNFNSTGIEIFFDTKWWNEQLVTFGFRYSRLLNANIAGLNANQWSFIVPLNLY